MDRRKEKTVEIAKTENHKKAKTNELVQQSSTHISLYLYLDNLFLCCIFPPFTNVKIDSRKRSKTSLKTIEFNFKLKGRRDKPMRISKCSRALKV